MRPGPIGADMALGLDDPRLARMIRAAVRTQHPTLRPDVSPVTAWGSSDQDVTFIRFTVDGREVLTKIDHLRIAKSGAPEAELKKILSELVDDGLRVATETLEAAVDRAWDGAAGR